MADIRYVIIADSTGAVKSVQKLDKQIDKMPETSKKAEGGMKNLWLQVGAGIAAAQGVIRGLKSMINFMKSTVEAAKVQEKAEIAMEAALRTTGREITKNSQHYKQYATEIQHVTRFGDEEILKSQALLLQLTNLSQNGIDKATEASIGLATVYDQDLSAATVLVGKALAGNYGALSRYGIKVDENLSQSEKQASLLEQLAVMYERAKQEAFSFSDMQKQLTGLWTDMKEQMGEAVTESKELRNNMFLLKQTMQALVESGVISDFAKSLDEMSKYIPIFKMLKGSLALISTELIDMAIAERDAREARENSIPNMETIAAYAETYGINLKFAVDWLKKLKKEQEDVKAGGDEFVTTIKTVNTEVEKASKDLQDLVEHLSPDIFDDTSDALTRFGSETEKVMEDMANIIIESNPVLQQVSTEIEVWRTKLELFSMKAQVVWNDIMNYAVPAIQGIDAVWNQMAINQNIRIDNEEKKRQSAIDKWYEQQKKAIMSSTDDEEERTRKLEELEEERRQKEAQLQEEMEQKRTEAKRKQAQRDKAVALMQATVNTASAVVEALPNLILAALVGVMGAAQIAAIASQPIPLAKGTIFDRPTYMVGEAGREALIPLDSSRGKDILRETFRSTNTPVYLTNKIILGKDVLRKEVIKIVEDETRLGRMKIASKAVV